MENLQRSVEEILERNQRVEADKAWETSWTRRIFITALTYVAAFVFMMMNGIENPALQAFIPPCAYLISTLTLPPLKRWWIRQNA
jgi:hypothetical protein